MSKIEEKGKIIKKTKLGKKTLLGNKTQEIKEQIIVVGNNINKEQKENKASFLLKLIIKAYYLSIWKRKIKALKYYSRKTNNQRMNFKKLINEISQVINQCKSKYFNEIYQKIDKLPIPKNIKHDQNFGTLKIVNKNKEKNNFESNRNDIIKYMVPNYINNINENYNCNYNNSNYEDKEKGPDYDNNFNEVEYNEEESLNNYNINNINKDSQNYIEVEEDTYFQNDYDYNQDNYNNNNKEEYYQQDNYYYNDPNYNNNEYNLENVYYYQNNNNYYYNDYYEEPYQTENININYESTNKVDFYKNVGNNVIISDVYVKPKVESNKYNYNYNKNNNIYRSKMNSKRAFPFSTHNHVFYISK